MTTPTTLTQTHLESRLIALQELYRRHREYVRTKYGISSLEMDIVQLVMQEGRHKMKEIGWRFGVKLSTLTSIIDRMEEEKLVRRMPSREDRRVVFLEGTRKSEKIYQDYVQYLKFLAEAFTQQREPEAVESFLSGLDFLIHLASADPESLRKVPE